VSNGAVHGVNDDDVMELRGITPPYPNFTNPAVQRTRSVAQALRPFPQYATINTTASGGDKLGRSAYQAGVLKVTQRLTSGFAFQGSYTYSRLMTNADTFNGSYRLDGHGAARSRVLDRTLRCAAQHQAEHRLRVAIRPRTALAPAGAPQPRHRRLAARRHPDLQQRTASRRHDQRAASDLQRHEPAKCHRRELARAGCGQTSSIRSSTGI
jgi:hypothetical protein